LGKTVTAAAGDDSQAIVAVKVDDTNGVELSNKNLTRIPETVWSLTTIQ